MRVTHNDDDPASAHSTVVVNHSFNVAIGASIGTRRHRTGWCWRRCRRWCWRRCWPWRAARRHGAASPGARIRGARAVVAAVGAGAAFTRAERRRHAGDFALGLARCLRGRVAVARRATSVFAVVAVAAAAIGGDLDAGDGAVADGVRVAVGAAGAGRPHFEAGFAARAHDGIGGVAIAARRGGAVRARAAGRGKGAGGEQQHGGELDACLERWHCEAVGCRVAVVCGSGSRYLRPPRARARRSNLSRPGRVIRFSTGGEDGEDLRLHLTLKLD